MAEPKKRKWVLFPIAAAVLVVAGVAAVRFLVVWPEPPGLEVKEADFRDNAERLAFVRNVLPFQVTDETKVEKIHLVEWLDANFSCVLKLAPGEFQILQGEFEAQWTGNQAGYRSESTEWTYEAVLNEEENTVTLHASSKPGH